jgi:hypothetical protein
MPVNKISKTSKIYGDWLLKAVEAAVRRGFINLISGSFSFCDGSLNYLLSGGFSRLTLLSFAFSGRVTDEKHYGKKE